MLEIGWTGRFDTTGMQEVKTHVIKRYAFVTDWFSDGMHFSPGNDYKSCAMSIVK